MENWEKDGTWSLYNLYTNLAHNPAIDSSAAITSIGRSQSPTFPTLPVNGQESLFLLSVFDIVQSHPLFH